ncbi:fluoride efflux transporter CrcB [Gemmatimonas groenlandica]|uniref:Fluoride-specific ion channel FluC n=2 Tax=Gemmatimonas groenlandica TaxID=2732249 RepID=A0A6M4IZ99_9BACT|nr:fluoride efflux transporter CrcB [Gemmatimonas groenlandica]
MPMLLAVAGGGAVGSVARYIVGVLLQRASTGFPVSTLVINVAGSFLIGLFARLFDAPDHNPVLRVALTVGICGGFTTFSTFSAETLMLLQQGKAARAALYIGVSVTAGILATFAGLSVGRGAR